MADLIQINVRKPGALNIGCCWALITRKNADGRRGWSWNQYEDNCGNHPPNGYLTCWKHRHLEAGARDHKRELEARNG